MKLRFRRLKHFYWSHLMDFGYRLHNVRVFLPAVWHFSQCDFDGLLDLIRIAAREMAKAHQSDGMGNWNKQARDLAVVTHICERLQEDKYDERAGYEYGMAHDKMRAAFERGHWAQSDDLLELRHRFRKLMCWWI